MYRIVEIDRKNVIMTFLVRPTNHGDGYLIQNQGLVNRSLHTNHLRNPSKIIKPYSRPSQQGRRKDFRYNQCQRRRNKNQINIIQIESTVKSDSLNISQRKHDALNKSNKRFGIGITGFDRITSPKYSIKIKIIWIFALLALCFAVIFQTGSCIKEYYYGSPAVSVAFIRRPYIPLPQVIMCPADFTSGNPLVDELKKQFKTYFNISKDDSRIITLSELLRLPNISVSKLWNMYPLKLDYLEVDIQCSISKLDDSCKKNLKVDYVDTITGRCLRIMKKGKTPIFGAVSFLNIKVLTSPSVIKWKNYFGFLRGLQKPEEVNAHYIEEDSGMTVPFNIHAIYILGEVEASYLNHPLLPCKDGNQVERCIERCIEQLLYSQVSCRLPFMKNDSLSLCETPIEFNKTYEISKKVIKQRHRCQAQCPRKCFEYLHILSAQVTQFHDIEASDAYFQIRALTFDQTVLRIKEYYWYSLTSLVADIGGSFGFLIDCNVLTLAEIMEITVEGCIFFIRSHNRKRVKHTEKYSFWNGRLSRKTRKVQNKPSLTDKNKKWLDKINIGLGGCDRIFNSKTSWKTKCLWIICLLISINLCYYQIRSTINNYQFGKPDVRLIPQKNNSIKFPTVTVCPYRPFEFSDFIESKKVELNSDFNFTLKPSLQNLINLTGGSFLDFWDEVQITAKTLIDLQIFAPPADNQEGDWKFNYSTHQALTINGKCLTVDMSTFLKFKGPSTLMLLMFENVPSLSVFVHSFEDDPRLLEPYVSDQVPHRYAGLWAIQARKKEFLNLTNFPCGNEFEVAKCRSDCYDSLIEQHVFCRLPFMKNESLAPCNSSDSIYKALVAALSFNSNFSETNWCGCPHKCHEYIFDVYRSDIKANFINSLPYMTILFQFPNSIILTTKEYTQMTKFTVFANISSSLGLFLGFSALTILEIIEAILVWAWR